MEDFQQFVEAARAGDEDAYAALIDSFGAMAYATAYKYLRDHQLAQDAVQEALLEVFMHLRQMKEPAAFPGWFRQIVFRQCTRILRRASFATSSLENSTLACSHCSSQSQPAVEQIVVKREMQAEVQRAIQALPPHERQVTTLFYIAHYSQQEISVQLGLPVTTIKKRLYSARQHLKQRLQTLAQEIAVAGSRNDDARGIVSRRAWLKKYFFSYVGVTKRSLPLRYENIYTHVHPQKREYDEKAWRSTSLLIGTVRPYLTLLIAAMPDIRHGKSSQYYWASASNKPTGTLFTRTLANSFGSILCNPPPYTRPSFKTCSSEIPLSTCQSRSTSSGFSFSAWNSDDLG